MLVPTPKLDLLYAVCFMCTMQANLRHLDSGDVRRLRHHMQLQVVEGDPTEQRWCVMLRVRGIV